MKPCEAEAELCLYRVEVHCWYREVAEFTKVLLNDSSLRDA